MLVREKCFPLLLQAIISNFGVYFLAEMWDALALSFKDYIGHINEMITKNNAKLKQLNLSFFSRHVTFAKVHFSHHTNTPAFDSSSTNGSTNIDVRK